VASQQGKYLARWLNELADRNDDETTKQAVGPFRYNHLGTLAYLGNTAVGDFKWGYKMVGGLWALYLWRSIYWSEQVSMRTRMNLSLDWTKCAIWGRDISRV
jgi:NADH dehydrogenase